MLSNINEVVSLDWTKIRALCKLYISFKVKLKFIKLQLKSVIKIINQNYIFNLK